MEFQQSINEQNEFYKIFLDFIESDNENDMNQNYENVISYIIEHKFLEQKDDSQEFLFLISNVSQNHQHTHSFFNKFEKILSHFGDAIKKNYTNQNLFDLFIFNKRILLFLFDQKILQFDEYVQDIILDQQDEEMGKYQLFFYPEIKQVIDDARLQSIEKKLLSIYQNIFNDYEKNRKIGENDSYICQLIRNDSIKEFIIYITKNNIKLTSEIKESIFETNTFLLNKKPTLIEYAAFNGSLQIFQYLQLNNVDLTPSLWIYSIHGRNANIIHILEENHVDYKINKLITESIKCHHNELVEYFKNTLLDQNDNNENFDEIIIRSHNYSCFQDFSNFNDVFCLASFYNCFKLVKILLQLKEIDINHNYKI